MNIMALLKNVPKVDINNSHKVMIVDVKQKGNILHTVTKTTERKNNVSKTRLHKQKVYPALKSYKGKLVDCPDVKVTCDCERFTFYYEYALAKKGAADIIQSTGEKPTTTNPSMKAGLCKHLTKVLLFIKKTGL